MNEENKKSPIHQFYLKSLRNDIPPIIFHRDVLTIGRSETCDVKIDNPYLSHIHSSIFFNDGEFFISDLNSTNGTYVNDERVKVIKLEIGDVIRFGAIKFQLMPLEPKIGKSNEDSTLETINPLHSNPLHQEMVIDKLVESVSPYEPRAKTNDKSEKIADSLNPPQLPKISEKSQVFESETTFSSLFISTKPVTPLDLVPALNYSEFIFEENAEGRAMDFTHRQPALEITVFISDFVVSVDYFLASQGSLMACGVANMGEALALPFLSSKEKIPFLNFHQGSFGLYDFRKEDGWKLGVFNQSGMVESFNTVDGFITLKKDYIITLTKNKVSIYIKHTDSPPKTLPVPLLLFDTLLNKVFFSLIPIFVALMVGIAFIPKVEKDFDEEKIEISRIIYVKEPPPIVVSPNPISNKPIDDSATKAVSKVEIKKPTETTAVSAPVQPKIESTKAVTPPIKVPEKVATANTTTAKVVEKKAAIVKEEAPEPVPPKLDLKALQNKVDKKLDANRVSTNVANANSANELEGATSLVGTTAGSTVKDVGPLKSDNTGAMNIAGANVGDLGKGKSINSSIGGDIGFFDGAGSRKEVLGIMDPSEIQNILRRYIPQFQFCYEKELERINAKLATTLVLQFTINSEGKPTNAKFESKNMTFTPQAIKCFEQVVYSIQFSKPKGGGVVGIKQPLNMEPRF